MKRIERIRTMPIEEMAEKIIKMPGGTFDFCKSDCGFGYWCPHEKQCCVDWLNEEGDESGWVLTKGKITKT